MNKITVSITMIWRFDRSKKDTFIMAKWTRINNSKPIGNDFHTLKSIGRCHAFHGATMKRIDVEYLPCSMSAVLKWTLPIKWWLSTHQIPTSHKDYRFFGHRVTSSPQVSGIRLLSCFMYYLTKLSQTFRCDIYIIFSSRNLITNVYNFKF